jgi:hypothetical protein
LSFDFFAIAIAIARARAIAIAIAIARARAIAIAIAIARAIAIAMAIAIARAIARVIADYAHGCDSQAVRAASVTSTTEVTFRNSISAFAPIRQPAVGPVCASPIKPFTSADQ